MREVLSAKFLSWALSISFRLISLTLSSSFKPGSQLMRPSISIFFPIRAGLVGLSLSFMFIYSPCDRVNLLSPLSGGIAYVKSTAPKSTCKLILPSISLSITSSVPRTAQTAVTVLNSYFSLLIRCGILAFILPKTRPSLVMRSLFCSTSRAVFSLSHTLDLLPVSITAIPFIPVFIAPPSGTMVEGKASCQAEEKDSLYFTSPSVFITLTCPAIAEEKNTKNRKERHFFIKSPVLYL